MKITIRTLAITTLFLLSMNCGNYDNSQNHKLIKYNDAKNQLTLVAMVKCSESGGNVNNYIGVNTFVNFLLSGSNTISTTDKKDLYYKRSNITNCALEILSLNLTSPCDFSEFSSLQYISSGKICNFKPDRSIKLDIINNN